jgi:hypothetical protein
VEELQGQLSTIKKHRWDSSIELSDDAWIDRDGLKLV